VTLIIDIKPEVQEALNRQAAALGVDLKAYAAGLLEEAAHAPPDSKMLSRNQLDRMLEELAQFTNKIPSLPEDAFSRDSLYRDHD
jgi:hypothetical protein